MYPCVPQQLLGGRVQAGCSQMYALAENIANA